MKTIAAFAFLAAIAIAAPLPATSAASANHPFERKQEQLVKIVGVTLDEGHRITPVGVITNIIITVYGTSDDGVLNLQFSAGPGMFSKHAQTAMTQAVIRAAKALGMTPDWIVLVSNPHPGLTIYGESLSAMVALSIIATVKGVFILPDRVMTGTITPDGYIGPVGSVPIKIIAADAAHLTRIVVPEEKDPGDTDWETPFLMQVSPVGTVEQAFKALTEHDGERLYRERR